MIIWKHNQCCAVYTSVVFFVTDCKVSIYYLVLYDTGSGALSRQCERHAVTAQTMEQADPKRQGALHPYAAVVTWPTGPEPQPDPEPGPRSGWGCSLHPHLQESKLKFCNIKISNLALQTVAGCHFTHDRWKIEDGICSGFIDDKESWHFSNVYHHQIKAQWRPSPHRPLPRAQQKAIPVHWLNQSASPWRAVRRTSSLRAWSWVSHPTQRAGSPPPASWPCISPQTHLASRSW